jgi:hypothetical protein
MTIKYGDIPPMGGVTVYVNEMLPPGSMQVSRDVWELMKKATTKEPTILEGNAQDRHAQEIVREARRQLEGETK